MYKVKFIKNVWDGESEQSSKNISIYTKDVELDFPPAPGVKFNFGRRAAECPTEIVWLCTEREFRVNMPDEFEGWKYDSFMDFEFNKQSLILEGWEYVGDMDVLEE